MKNFFELFLSLINSLLSSGVAPAAFKAEYMRLWRECRDSGELETLNASMNQAFDRIFTAADAYCEDATLRESSDLNEQQLVGEVRMIAQEMRLLESG